MFDMWENWKRGVANADPNRPPGYRMPNLKGDQIMTIEFEVTYSDGRKVCWETSNYEMRGDETNIRVLSIRWENENV